jgi:hypothetical protein
MYHVTTRMAKEYFSTRILGLSGYTLQQIGGWGGLFNEIVVPDRQAHFQTQKRGAYNLAGSACGDDDDADALSR